LGTGLLYHSGSTALEFKKQRDPSHSQKNMDQTTGVEYASTEHQHCKWNCEDIHSFPKLLMRVAIGIPGVVVGKDYPDLPSFAALIGTRIVQHANIPTSSFPPAYAVIEPHTTSTNIAKENLQLGRKRRSRHRRN